MSSTDAWYPSHPRIHPQNLQASAVASRNPKWKNDKFENNVRLEINLDILKSIQSFLLPKLILGREQTIWYTKTVPGRPTTCHFISFFNCIKTASKKQKKDTRINTTQEQLPLLHSWATAKRKRWKDVYPTILYRGQVLIEFIFAVLVREKLFKCHWLTQNECGNVSS